MTCDICERIKSKKGLVYLSEKVAVFIPEEAVTRGHIVVAPIGHYPILESVPEETIKEMFIIANKVGIAVFEGLGAQGTNFLIQNGTAAGQEYPHVMLNVIPRKENDGIDMLWTPKQMTEEEMSTIELQLKEQMKEGGEQKPAETRESEKKDGAKKENEKKEDYRLKSLIRIP